jgi:hypothetical protein
MKIIRVHNPTDTCEDCFFKQFNFEDEFSAERTISCPVEFIYCEGAYFKVKPEKENMGSLLNEKELLFKNIKKLYEDAETWKMKGGLLADDPR